jgi:flagellar hook-basal body complex protein FliE
MEIGSFASIHTVQDLIRASDLARKDAATGKQSAADFSTALAQQINEQAAVALNPQDVRAMGPSTYKGVALQMLEQTQSAQNEASKAVQSVLRGEGGSLHGAMVAMEEASVSFQLMVEMRNKIVESLQEVMRMQV